VSMAKITVAEAAAAVATAPEAQRVEIISPFVEEAGRVLMQECREQVGRGKVYRVRSPQTSHDVSAIIAMTGAVSGLVILSLEMRVAREVASRMIGEPVPELDPMAQSAIAELANMIAGQAGIGLEQAGFPTDISPPMLLVGAGTALATFNLTRLVIPLVLSFGDFLLDIAVKES